MDKKVALKITNLGFRRDAHAPYLFKNENFEIHFGDICFIKGNNGSGKSTLFNILSGKTNPNSYVEGSIEINTQKKACDQVAILPQKYTEILASEFSFDENIGLSRLPKFPGLRLFRKNTNVHNVTKGLQVDRKLPIKHLSEGQKQILAIKITLLKNPCILLLDEPTATLDEQNANQVFSFLKTLVMDKRIAIMVICHQSELINQYGNRCLEIKQGYAPESSSSIVSCLVPLYRKGPLH